MGIKYYDEAQHVLADIEVSRNPEGTKNVAIFMARYITEQASAKLQRPVWICAMAVCRAKFTAWPDDNEPLEWD